MLNAQKILGDNAIILPSDVGYKATFNLVTMNGYIENNPELIRKVIKALVKAEEFASNNRGESIDIIASRLKLDGEDIDKLWDDYNFRLTLSQSLIMTLEDEARWAIKNKLTDATEVPNYLDYIYMDALEDVEPECVGSVHSPGVSVEDHVHIVLHGGGWTCSGCSDLFFGSVVCRQCS